MPDTKKYRIVNKKDMSYVRLINAVVSITKDEALAHKFSLRERAENLIKNTKSLSSQSSNWSIEEVIIKNDSPSEEIPNVYSESKCKGIDFDKIERDFEELPQKFEEFVAWSENLVKEKDKLSVALSKIDQEKSDIDHTIEFGTFNACEGYKLSKKLQEIMCRRRIIKDAFALMPYLEQMHEVLNSCSSKMDSRTYTPKVLKDVIIKPPKNFISDKKAEEA